MATLIPFGVGLGNLGMSSRQRIPAVDWIRQLNEALTAKASSTQIVCSYGHTGNFVVSATADPKMVVAELGDVLGTPCAAMPVLDLREIVQTFKNALRRERTPQVSDLLAGRRF